jgi:predicted nucleic acid-binding protein
VGLSGDLGRGRTGIDTAIFIYFLEEDPRFVPLIEPLFIDADEGRRELVTSALTLLEIMVVLYRAGNQALAERYEGLLTRSRGLLLVNVSREQLRAAAQLRATTGVKTPGALQLAAALSTGCSAFLTNDRRIPAITGTRVLQLADYLP